jgi:hypothetical protein
MQNDTRLWAGTATKLGADPEMGSTITNLDNGQLWPAIWDKAVGCGQS